MNCEMLYVLVLLSYPVSHPSPNIHQVIPKVEVVGETSSLSVTRCLHACMYDTLVKQKSRLPISCQMRAAYIVIVKRRILRAVMRCV